MSTCRLCEGQKIRKLHQLEMHPEKGLDGWTMEVVQCQGCGLIFLEPTAALDRSQRFNAEWWERIWGPVYTQRATEVRQASEEKSEWLEKHFPARGSLLDVGCGEGAFILSAQQRGWEVRGLEVAEAAVKRAREKVGQDRVFCSFEEAQFQEDSFDVATLWDVIEHVPDPVKILCDLSRVVRPGGSVVVSTPNTRSLLHRIAHYSGRWTWDKITIALRRIYFPGHLYYFDPSTIKLALDKASFRSTYFDNDLAAPGGIFDNLDAVFTANQGVGWTRIPLAKQMIKVLLSLSSVLGRPYRLLIIAQI